MEGTGVHQLKIATPEHTVLCFAFQLALMMKCEMVRCRPTYLRLLLTTVRIVTANSACILETPGPPAFA
jgi:hypothetical protein